ncbi:hypothetical protein PanWU01x14_091170 [Parasponia andersonii]|uniref:Uncharacterized protein n=1 Tax=Parasponia andersonii TaxID=3476 RepID=A0A2P5D711_PARAD|nr:hypothetical protein PanWU01x14_091170 [Parasponia andersonii]
MWRHAIAKVPPRRLAVRRAGRGGPACEGNASESEWARHDPSSGGATCVLHIFFGRDHKTSFILIRIFAANPTLPASNRLVQTRFYI